MVRHFKFKYHCLDDLNNDIKKMNLSIPISENIEILKKSIMIGSKKIYNRLAIQPMEGCDGTLDGRPGKLTFRRYKRFAQSGVGLLWFEATAVLNEGRANPRQLLISEINIDDIRRLLESTLYEAKSQFNLDYKPYTVLQLTHSGRYSRPNLQIKPMIAVNNPYLNNSKLREEHHVTTDEELMDLEDKFVEAAVMAEEIGFDAVDIKSCHRYLISELLSAHTREGKYGGNFKNRTRFLLNIIDKIRRKLSDKIEITVRLNAYDAIPYPYGWGVKKEDFRKYDLTEPIRLIKIMRDKGVKLVNISIGNPYHNPHIGRPYDIGPYYTPHEHPLIGVERILSITKEIQENTPDVAIVATGFSWLREYGANVAAGGIKDRWFSIAGFGRQAFAYPHFAKDIIEKGKMQHSKCCITCSKCTEIMRGGGMTGCVIRDSKVYNPIYKKVRKSKAFLIGTHVSEHL